MSVRPETFETCNLERINDSQYFTRDRQRDPTLRASGTSTAITSGTSISSASMASTTSAASSVRHYASPRKHSIMSLALTPEAATNPLRASLQRAAPLSPDELEAQDTQQTHHTLQVQAPNDSARPLSPLFSRARGNDSFGENSRLGSTRQERPRMSVIQDIIKPNLTSPGKTRVQSSLFFSPESSTTSFQVVLYEKGSRGKEREIHVDQSRGQISKIDETKRCLKTFQKSSLRCVERSLSDRRCLRLSFVEKKDEYIIQAVFDSPQERERFLRLIFEMFSFKPLSELSYLNHTDVEFSTHKFFIGTWNIGEALPPQSIRSWLPEEPCDVYVFGFQESSYDSKQRNTEPSEKDWFASYSSDLLQVLQSNLGEDYSLVENVALWSIRLTIFVKQKHLPNILRVESGTVATGVGGVLGNKGGAAIGFYYYQTPIIFVNSHLAARKDRLKERELNYREILKGVTAGIRGIDMTNQFHHVFWIGDLNYRIKLPFEETVELARLEDWTTLLQSDQLIEEMANGSVFEGFQEGKMHFCPTYRYLRNCNEWSNKKGQSPSYCDRILWHSLQGLATNVRQQLLYPCMDIMTSDHRPVGSLFELDIRNAYTPSYIPIVCHLEITDIKVQFSRKSEYIPEAIGALPSPEDVIYTSITTYCPSIVGVSHQAEWNSPVTASIPSILSETETTLHRTFLGHVGWLMHEHLIACIEISGDKSGSKFPLLATVLPLKDAFGDKPAPFRHDLRHAGKALGTFSGFIHIRIQNSNQLS